jgi:hypothetical protein
MAMGGCTGQMLVLGLLLRVDWDLRERIWHENWLIDGH